MEQGSFRSYIHYYATKYVPGFFFILMNSAPNFHFSFIKSTYIFYLLIFYSVSLTLERLNQFTGKAKCKYSVLITFKDIWKKVCFAAFCWLKYNGNNFKSYLFSLILQKFFLIFQFNKFLKIFVSIPRVSLTDFTIDTVNGYRVVDIFSWWIFDTFH